MSEPERIFVKSTLPVRKDGGSPVAFTETNTAHPNGEAFVAGKKPVEVASTAAVLAALREGRIEKTAAPAKSPAPASKESQQSSATSGVDLPESLPHHDDLVAAGIKTRSQVARMTDAALIALPAIGKAGVAEIRKVIPAEGAK
jgi:hypothetical protein